MVSGQVTQNYQINAMAQLRDRCATEHARLSGDDRRTPEMLVCSEISGKTLAVKIVPATASLQQSQVNLLC